MKQALIIYNQTAGMRYRKDICAQVQARLDELGFSSKVLILDEGFEKALENFNARHFSLVVAIGGDGTAKVAAHVILDNSLDAKLAIIPFGTGNMLATALGIPVNPARAARMLSDSSYQSIDVGSVDGKHYFLVGMSAGYVSEVVLATAANLKRNLGVFGYVVKTLLGRIAMKRLDFDLEIDGEDIRARGHSLVAFNSCNLYGFKPRIKVSHDDGLLNLLVISTGNIWTLLLAGLNLWINGKPRKLVFAREAQRIKVTLPKAGLHCQIDGDRIRLPRQFEISVLPKKLKVLAYGKTSKKQ